MRGSTTSSAAWELVERQHGVITRSQLLGVGFTSKAIEHRVRRRKLRPMWRGVYAVGRGGLTQLGWWMGAVLACGAGAVLSHASAAALWGIRPLHPGPIDVSVPRPRDARRDGIRTHRRNRLPEDEIRTRHAIPVTSPARTIIDIAPALTERQLERVINEADKLDLIHPEPLREAAAQMAGTGAALVRNLLDKRTFLLTDSDLERLFIPIAEAAGLPQPERQAEVNGHTVDFLFRELDLVVETDGGRFHRTPLQQTTDRIRDQAHAAAGMTPLRFTHAQIRYEPEYVEHILRKVARRRAA